MRGHVVGGQAVHVTHPFAENEAHNGILNAEEDRAILSTSHRKPGVATILDRQNGRFLSILAVKPKHDAVTAGHRQHAVARSLKAVRIIDDYAGAGTDPLSDVRIWCRVTHGETVDPVLVEYKHAMHVVAICGVPAHVLRLIWVP